MNAWCQYCYDTTPVRAASCEGEPCEDLRNYFAVKAEADVVAVATKSAEACKKGEEEALD